MECKGDTCGMWPGYRWWCQVSRESYIIVYVQDGMPKIIANDPNQKPLEQNLTPSFIAMLMYYRRTYKYLMGVLSGKSLISETWLGACLASKSASPLSEHAITRDAMGFEGGPARALAAVGNASKAGSKLMAGCEVYLQGEFIKKSQMQDLVKAAGGRLISRPPTADKSSSSSGTPSNAKGGLPKRVILCEPPEESEAALQGFKTAMVEESWYARALGAGVPVASYRWLTDSISAYQVQPLDRYVM